MPNFDDVQRPLKNADAQQNMPSEAHSRRRSQVARRNSARKRAGVICVILMLACLGLTACGSSGSSSKASATGAATSSTGATATGTASTGGSSTQGAAPGAVGGNNLGSRSSRGGGFRRVNSPVFRAALTKYAACLRQHGIALPAPNTSGNGPVFSTKGIDTSSPKFKAATIKCRASLISAFRRPHGAGGAAGTGSPPASATTKSPEASR
jgi:hypothetical protein